MKRLTRDGHFFNTPFFYLTLVFGLFLACNLPEPSAPSWDMDVNIPLINKTYDIEEFLDDADELKADSLDNVIFEFADELESFSAENQLKVAGLNQGFAQTLGSFTIDSPGGENVSIAFRDIFAQADVLHGQTTIVPPFTIDPLTKSLPIYEDFNWVEIAQGAIDISIENNLPIPLGMPITIEVRNAVTNQLVSSAVFNQLVNPGNVAIERLDLQGKRLNSELEIIVSGSSPGSNGDLVQIDAYAGFTITALFTDLTVSAASAKVAEQVISQADQFTIQDSVVLTEAWIREGSFSVAMSGDFPVNTQVLVSIPGFKTPTGAAFIDSLVIPQGGSNNLFVDLAGYSFVPAGEDFGQQTVDFSWEVKTLHNPDIPIEIYATSNLSAEFVLSELIFSEISGKFASKWIDIPEQFFALDLVENLDSLAFLDANLHLTLYSQIDFPTTTDLHLLGENENGESVEVVIQEVVNGGVDGAVVKNDIILNGSNSNIVDLINIIPSSIKVSGRVRVGDPQTLGSIRETDEVSGDVLFSAPLAFMLPAQSYESEVSEIDIDDDLKDELDSNLNSGSITMLINSHLPVGASLEMLFAETDSTVFTNPGLIIGPVSFESGEIDPVTGLVIAPVMSHIEIELSEQETNYFTSDSLFSATRLIFPGTDGNIVKLLTTDYIDVRANITLSVHVEDSSKEGAK
ncbi:MAG: hypothetical protein DWQ05_04030 [Calditrichaeota bacterium]|nr:MAG: hypothetical protein DWQ05_04030 [Calditrichota bacterium]